VCVDSVDMHVCVIAYSAYTLSKFAFVCSCLILLVTTLLNLLNYLLWFLFFMNVGIVYLHVCEDVKIHACRNVTVYVCMHVHA
jgi:hypothetical protein